MHTHMLDIGGRRVRVLRWGSLGEPAVLMLHGNPDSAELWREVAERLVGCCCIAPDLPGFGASEPHSEPPTLVRMSRWTQQVVLQVQASIGVTGPWHLVLHDFGGPYGLSWAVEHPAAVRSVTLSNTLFYPSLRWHRWARIWRTPGLGELVTRWTPRWAFRRELRIGGPLLPEAHIEAAWRKITPATYAAVLALYRATDPEVFSEPIPQGGQTWVEAWRAMAGERPCQVLWGQRDPYLHPGWAEDLGVAVVVRFPQAGHWLPAEQPGPFAERLLTFIDCVELLKLSSDSASEVR
ncbi:MAG: alpha/beta hydrolase [Deltaproteobacteria bacterium]|nr:MAG: alpha/beta hydrolase [Deltaproteobacteria bacterium]